MSLPLRTKDLVSFYNLDSGDDIGVGEVIDQHGSNNGTASGYTTNDAAPFGSNVDVQVVDDAYFNNADSGNTCIRVVDDVSALVDLNDGVTTFYARMKKDSDSTYTYVFSAGHSRDISGGVALLTNQVRVGDTSGGYFSTNFAEEAEDEFHDYFMLVDNTNVRVYVNGVEKINTAHGITGTISNASPFNIFARHRNSGGLQYPSKAHLSRFRVWKGDLTVDEMTTESNNDIAVKGDGLVVQYSALERYYEGTPASPTTIKDVNYLVTGPNDNYPVAWNFREVLFTDEVSKAPAGGYHSGSFGLEISVAKTLRLTNCTIDANYTGDLEVRLYRRNANENFSDSTLVKTMNFPISSTGEQDIAIDFTLEPGERYLLARIGSDSLLRTDTGESLQTFNGEFTFHNGRQFNGGTFDRWYYFFNIDYEVLRPTQYIELEDPIPLDILDCTLALWVRVEDETTLTTIAGQLSNRYITGSTRRGHFLVGINSNMRAQARYYPSPSSSVNSAVLSPTLNKNAWYRIVFRNKNGLGELFVNGQKVDDNPDMNDMWGTPEIQWIGRSKAGGAYGYLTGGIAGVPIIDRWWSDAEVLADWNNGEGTPYNSITPTGEWVSDLLTPKKDDYTEIKFTGKYLPDVSLVEYNVLDNNGSALYDDMIAINGQNSFRIDNELNGSDFRLKLYLTGSESTNQSSVSDFSVWNAGSTLQTNNLGSDILLDTTRFSYAMVKPEGDNYWLLNGSVSSDNGNTWTPVPTFGLGFNITSTLGSEPIYRLHDPTGSVVLKRVRGYFHTPDVF